MTSHYEIIRYFMSNLEKASKMTLPLWILIKHQHIASSPYIIISCSSLWNANTLHTQLVTPIDKSKAHHYSPGDGLHWRIYFLCPFNLSACNSRHVRSQIILATMERITASYVWTEFNELRAMLRRSIMTCG